MYKKIPTARRTPSGCALLIVFSLMCLLLSLAGCDSPAATDKGAFWVPSVWQDTETGCQYLSPRDGKSLTPRMDRNGKQVCK